VGLLRQTLDFVVPSYHVKTSIEMLSCRVCFMYSTAM